MELKDRQKELVALVKQFEVTKQKIKESQKNLQEECPHNEISSCLVPDIEVEKEELCIDCGKFVKILWDGANNHISHKFSNIAVFGYTGRFDFLSLKEQIFKKFGLE